MLCEEEEGKETNVTHERGEGREGKLRNRVWSNARLDMEEGKRKGGRVDKGRKEGGGSYTKEGEVET